MSTNNRPREKRRRSKRLEEATLAYGKGQYLRAFDLLLPLAQEGIGEAQCMIATMHHLGLGIPVNGPEAVKWYELATASGYAVAPNNLATIYTTGLPGVPPDPKRATELHEIARLYGFDVAPRTRE